MIRLEWPIKESLLRYMRGMPDGVVACTDGALAGATGFVFPAASGRDEWRFTGSVTLTGHGGCRGAAAERIEALLDGT